MAHSFRQNHLRLLTAKSASRLSEPLPLAGPILIGVLLIVGYAALGGTLDLRIGALWSKALEVSGLVTAPTTPQRPAATSAPAAPDRSTISARFGVCGFAPHRNCVIDGDTFYLGGESIRIADIDAPETHPSRCAREADLGERATRRLSQLLSSAPFVLQDYERDRDVYGRKLRIVEQNGRSVGGVLVDEGLARRWTGRKQAWC